MTLKVHLLFLLILFNIYGYKVHTFAESCGKIIIGRGNIIGGNYAIRGTFPWVAVLKHANGVAFCGGTLLTNNKVLTAAHCIHGKRNAYKFDAHNITVMLGAHNIGLANEIGRVTVGVNDIQIHRDWDAINESFDADIAILTLNQDVTFSQYIQPICLINPDSRAALVSSGYSVGYGKSEDESKIHEDILKMIQTPIQSSNEECFYTNEFLYKISSLRTFCGGTRGGTGVCMGDSGNGLFVEHNGVHYIRGIVSASLYTHLNCDVNNYSIFTNVIKFVKWIKEKVYSGVNEDIYRYLTIWTPMRLYGSKYTNVIILPTNLDRRTEISVMLLGKTSTVLLNSKKLMKLQMQIENPLTTRKFLDSVYTLYRNETNSTGTHHMCMSISLPIDSEPTLFYIYIQTDKPIYNPGDTVNIRFVVIDRYLKPYHMNTINVTIVDSKNHVLVEFHDIESDWNFGEFDVNFELSTTASIGNYEIHIIVDRSESRKKTKTFLVKSYNLPQFDVYIKVKEVHLLQNSLVEFSFYAAYPHGDLVFGIAKLMIKCLNTKKTMSQNFQNLKGIKTVKLDISKIVTSNSSSNQEYEATILYQDIKSLKIASKSTQFTIHADNNPKIVADHPEQFTPGYPFGLKIHAYDWKNNLIKKSNELVRIVLLCQLENNVKKVITANAEIKNGVAQYNFIVHNNAVELTLIIEYGEAYYEKTVKIGRIGVQVSSLIVDHSPKSPKLGENVTIYVKADTELDQIIGTAMTRDGNYGTYLHHCKYHVGCKFDITIDDPLLLHSTIVVYFVQNRLNIYRGETIIDADEVSRNSIDIQISVQADELISMSITTKPDSMVYLSAYDKRLTYLADGNYIKVDDVIKDLKNYHTGNHVASFHLIDSNLRKCTQKELNNLEYGRQRTVQNRKRDTSIIQNNDLWPIAELNQRNQNNDHKRPKRNQQSFKDLSTYQQSYILNGFSVKDGNITKLFKFPNTTATWIVQSISIHENYGLAIGQPKEFVVGN
ncbi:thioester-containing protein 1 allele R1-like [Chironomus tepperi]|uniref:thioester-containing protein 1 allele R1-like n=1 Tax=Chironomus tepperi TaxID=113505 RepID=UPI00391F8ABF